MSRNDHFSPARLICFRDKTLRTFALSSAYLILETQDADGYLGIYDQELRCRFESESGELWAKTTLLRGLLAYYEFTSDQKVWNAIVKAVDYVMTNYPIHQSNPFFA